MGWEDEGTYDGQDEISATVVPSLLASKKPAPEESGEHYGLWTYQRSKLYLIVDFLAGPIRQDPFRQSSVQIELSGCPATTCRRFLSSGIKNFGNRKSAHGKDWKQCDTSKICSKLYSIVGLMAAASRPPLFRHSSVQIERSSRDLSRRFPNSGQKNFESRKPAVGKIETAKER